jgi:hypothetical protein
MPPDELKQTAEVERLLQEIRARRGVDQVGARHHGDGDVRAEALAPYSGQHLEAAHSGHHDVQEDKPGVEAALKRRERLKPVARRHHLKTFPFEERSKHVAKVFVIVDDQNGKWGSHGRTKGAWLNGHSYLSRGAQGGPLAAAPR